MRRFFSIFQNNIKARWLGLLFLGVAVLVFALSQIPSHFWSPTTDSTNSPSDLLKTTWHSPDTSAIPQTPQGDLIRYGRKLISNTAYYLGPNGVAGKICNAMNCQNCHIAAGAKPYGNSFSGVASIYPVFRPRSGIVESIEFRINDCLQRSMNGRTIDTATQEMRAMVAYLKWIGQDVPKGTRPEGTGTIELPYLKRPADPLNGKILYANKCRLCHGKKGEGLRKPAGEGFVYPPLWGAESYNTGAGLFRLSRFAGFAKFNMPFGAEFGKPQLTDEEAWDVAAFVNSQPRPAKSFLGDWPDLKRKAVDYPFGPYADGFSEQKHKYGPFGPLKKFQDSVLHKKSAGK